MLLARRNFLYGQALVYFLGQYFLVEKKDKCNLRQIKKPSLYARALVMLLL